jgi:hypothetical protein
MSESNLNLTERLREVLDIRPNAAELKRNGITTRSILLALGLEPNKSNAEAVTAELTVLGCTNRLLRAPFAANDVWGFTGLVWRPTVQFRGETWQEAMGRFRPI